mmetsp:Transcript_12569/g.27899  ORF Transcript_12569/g.27899 Transcript_12569/m.27899 type:complete len:512 (-) Transcript_12569:176-1711(-)
MTSQVVANFEKRLAGLAEGASRESIQTLSLYVAFNRKKHGAALAAALSNVITNTAQTPGRKMLYLNVVHEVLISESPLQPGYQNDKKWDRQADLRSLLGENVVVDAVTSIRDCEGTTDATLDKVKSMIDMWEEIEAFGGPTIIAAARKALVSGKQKDAKAVAATATTTSEANAAHTTPPSAQSVPEAQGSGHEHNGEISPAAEEAAAEPSSAALALGPAAQVDPIAVESKAVPEAKDASSVEDKADTNGKDDAAVAQVLAEGSGGGEDDDKASAKDGDASGTAPSNVDVPPSFDFEAEGVPYEKVEPHQILGSCRSLATMQISRDVRSDTAVRISTALSTLSPDVEKACHKALADADGDMSKAKVDLESIPTISDDVLDLNIDDAIKNVKQYKEIIVKQREARKALIDMLIKSRCKFGSMEAAEAFYAIGEKEEKLKKRRLLLQDAMALEGLDVLEDDEENEDDDTETDLNGADEGELAPLTWYEKEKAGGAEGGDGASTKEPEAKKARVQ